MTFTEEEARQLIANAERGRMKVISKGFDLRSTPKKSNKYNAIITEFEGVVYRSKMEAQRARELTVLKKVGNIEDWFPHPKFELRDSLQDRSFVLVPKGEKPFIYTADFFVKGLEFPWVEDQKGSSKLKQRDRDILKLWKKFGIYDLHFRFKDPSKNIIIRVQK